MTLDELIDRSMADLAAGTRHDPQLASTVRRRSRRRRVVTLAPIAAAVAVALVITAAALASPNRTPSTSAPPLPLSACEPLHPAVLPTWARAGFSDPEPKATYVASESGAMLAIVFASPLTSPVPPDRANKILWVPNVQQPQFADMVLTGRLEGGTATTSTTFPGGPGPSYLDVPVPGCWHFDLSWGTLHDSIDLEYMAP